MCKMKPWRSGISFCLFLHSFPFRSHPQFPVGSADGVLLAPSASWSLFAGEHLTPLAAGVALDEAAPLELAVALPHAGVLVCVVAPSAAHEVAAVGVRGGVVAEAPPCARAARGGVLLAVVGRALKVHQVCDGGFLVAAALFETQEGGLAQACGTHRLHLRRRTVPLLQHVTNLTELGQCCPAGLGGAGA